MKKLIITLFIYSMPVTAFSLQLNCSLNIKLYRLELGTQHIKENTIINVYDEKKSLESLSIQAEGNSLLPDFYSKESLMDFDRINSYKSKSTYNNISDANNWRLNTTRDDIASRTDGSVSINRNTGLISFRESVIASNGTTIKSTEGSGKCAKIDSSQRMF